MDFRLYLIIQIKLCGYSWKIQSFHVIIAMISYLYRNGVVLSIQ